MHSKENYKKNPTTVRRGPRAPGGLARAGSGARGKAQDDRNESSLASTLKTLLFFTALMITVPTGLYFTTKSYVFEGAFGMSNRDSYFYAAIVAVVAVHVVLALFVYVAWNEKLTAMV